MPQSKSLGSLLSCNDNDFVDFIDVSEPRMTWLCLEMRGMEDRLATHS